MAAENIAAGYPTPEAVIDAFFNETPPNDGHRRNLLNCGLRDVGFAVLLSKGQPLRLLLDPGFRHTSIESGGALGAIQSIAMMKSRTS